MNLPPEPRDFYVTEWPLFWRRAFVLTLPISGPLWIAVFVIYCLLIVFLSLPLGLYWLVKDEWWDRRPSDG